MANDSVHSTEGVQFQQLEERTSLLLNQSSTTNPSPDLDVTASEQTTQDQDRAAMEEIGRNAITSRPPALLVGTVLLAALCVVVAARWIHQLGGLSPSLSVSNSTVFNWHPTLMILAFLFMTVGALSFRFVNSNDGAAAMASRRQFAKRVHASSWCVAALCMTLALVAVFQSHNNPERPIANLYSLHSWVGLLVVAAYLTQLGVGILVFYDAWQISAPTKARVLKAHKVVGPVVYLCLAATILLGIQEKEGFVGCSYKVDRPDTVPFRHVFEIPPACFTSHLLGLAVLVVAVLTSMSWWDASSSFAVQEARRMR
jgi:cytochrome b-561